MVREYVVELVTFVESKLAEELEELPRPSAETCRRVEMLLEEHVVRSTPRELDIDRLVAAARSELVGLGPLDALASDDSVHRLRVAQRDVHVQRRGQGSGLEGLGFATEAGVVRVVRRLCADAGKPVEAGESVVERELPDGRKLSALLPPAALDGAVLQLRRTRTEPTSLNQLVRGGTLSRGMAMLLAHAMSARANLLVVGPADQGGDDVVSALCLATPRIHQLLAIGDADFGGRAVRLAARVEDAKLSELVRAAARMAPDHLACRPLSSEALLALLDAVADGQLGVVLANPAGTLRQALDRLAADVAATRAMDVGTARDWISSAFDLAVEVGRLRDGRVRVLRIAELKGSAPRDVFTFSYHRTAAGGSVEGSFTASGLIPRLADDLAARGMALDTAIFRRHPSG
jgi:pilus assembly protein CpaF